MRGTCGQPLRRDVQKGNLGPRQTIQETKSQQEQSKNFVLSNQRIFSIFCSRTCVKCGRGLRESAPIGCQGSTSKRVSEALGGVQYQQKQRKALSQSNPPPSHQLGCFGERRVGLAQTSDTSGEGRAYLERKTGSCCYLQELWQWP